MDWRKGREGRTERVSGGSGVAGFMDGGMAGGGEVGGEYLELSKLK